MRKIIPGFIIFLFGIYGLKLLWEDKIGWYINIRYESFFIFSIFICLIFGALGFLDGISDKSEKKSTSLIKYLPIIITLAIGIIIPPRVLSISSSFSMPQNTPEIQKEYMPNNIVKYLHLDTDSRKYSFSDWLNIRGLDNNFSFQKDKKVHLIGMVGVVEGVSSDIFFIERYRITCCAIDATPYGFPVSLGDWRNNFSENDWVEVSGKFRVEKRKGINKLIIIPDQINKIPQPDDPYMYY